MPIDTHTHTPSHKKNPKTPQQHQPPPPPPLKKRDKKKEEKKPHNKYAYIIIIKLFCYDWYVSSSDSIIRHSTC